MFTWRKRKPRSRNLQLARSDYLVHRVRELLPGAYLAHEKRFAVAQLEAITLVSTGGMYAINTFDLHGYDGRERPNTLTCGDVIVSFDHVPGTHETITDDAIAAAIADANRQFEEQLSSADPGFENRVVRLTCEMEFVAEEEIDQTARQLLDKLAQHGGAEAIAWPYSLHDLFVPGFLAPDAYSLGDDP